MVDYIYYTGIGAKKNGKHTVKQFLDIMNKNFKIECSESLPEVDYKPCSDYKKMNNTSMEYSRKHNKPLFDYKRSKKNETKYKKLINKCNQYKKTAKKRKCNVDDYIKFSGAEKNTSGV
jgi:hypothetical protein